MNIKNRFVVGYLTPGQVSAGFCQSLINLALNEEHFAGVIARTNGVDLCRGRNLLAEAFMQSNMPWLLMLDSDITFQPTIFQQLLAVADGTTIAVGPYYSFNSDTREVKQTIKESTGSFDPELMRIPYDLEWSGAGCMLIHRKVLQGNGPPWFLQAGDGQYLEDVGFCHNMRATGASLVCVPSVKLGHTKQITIWPEDYFAYQRNKPNFG